MPLHPSCPWNDPDLLHCEWLHSPIYGTEAKMPSEFLVAVLSSDHRPPAIPFTFRTREKLDYQRADEQPVLSAV